MKSVNKEYKKIIKISEAAKYSLTFYENVKNNADSIVKDYKLASTLNKKSNMKLGARGIAYKSYQDAKAYGEDKSNSKRMLYLSDKYMDTVNFLDGVAYLKNKDFNNAQKRLNKIKDSTLKRVLSNRIKQLK